MARMRPDDVRLIKKGCLIFVIVWLSVVGLFVHGFWRLFSWVFE